VNLGQKAKVKRQKSKVLDQINLHFIPIFQNNPDIINSDTNFFMLASMVLTLKFRQAQFIAFDLCTLTFDFIFHGLSKVRFYITKKGCQKYDSLFCF